MKRSEINACIKDMEQLIKAHGFELPPFCNWTPEEWQDKNHEYDEIRDNMLGWDITDYGLGKFDEVGFSLITIRNGNLKMDKYTKTYAEKLLLVLEALARQTQPVKLVDLAHQVGMNQSTCYRFVAALQNAGYAAQDSAYKM